MKNIMKIINEWDPIDLFPLAPQDEYSSEISYIEKVIKNSEKISVEDLAQVIDDVFAKSFGDGIYLRDLERCTEVAKKIMSIR